MFNRKEMESKIDSFNDKGEIANFILKNVRELLNEDNLAINEVLDIFSSEKFPKELFYDAKFMGELAGMSKYSADLISSIRVNCISSDFNDQLKFSQALARSIQGSKFFYQYDLICGIDKDEITKEFVDKILTTDQRKVFIEFLSQLVIRNPGEVFRLPVMSENSADFDADFYKSVIHKATKIPQEELTSEPERATLVGLLGFIDLIEKEREGNAGKTNDLEKE